MNNRSQPPPPPDQHAAVVLKDADGEILISCGRCSLTKKPEEDSVFLVAHLKDADDIKISLQLREAEEFFDLVIPLVSEKKERPFAGTLSVSTMVGDEGVLMEVVLEHHEAYVAHVQFTASENGDHPGASFEVDRTVLDRFFHCAREGICDDLTEDD